MNFKAVFVTATAIGLFLAMPAHADDNFSNVVQDGEDNSGAVTQGPGADNELGTEGDAASQSGDDNSFTILQHGSRNQVGTRGTGFDQSGSFNLIVIDQLSDGNRVNQVEQLSSGGLTTRNSATVTQQAASGATSESRNTVTRLRQEHTGGPANTANIVQTNEGTSVDGNIVGIDGGNSVNGGLLQIGGGNEAQLQQTGNGNRIRRLEQDGQRNGLAVSQAGVGNVADALMVGDRNGTADAGAFGLVVTAGSSVSQGEILQIGVENEAFLDMVGNRNLFGIAQDGDLNRAVGRVTGDANEFAISQMGSENLGRVIVGGGFASDRNEIVLNQNSEFGANSATIDILGNRNFVVAEQESAFGQNDLNVAISGNRNFLDLSQTKSGSGFGNSLTASIWGSDNNLDGSFTSGLPAAQMAGGLRPGQIVQNGAGNSITLVVGDPLAPGSDGNLFAFAQEGNGNGIIGSILGIGNEIAIVQAGSSNFASFSQVGNYNIVGINQ